MIGGRTGWERLAAGLPGTGKVLACACCLAMAACGPWKEGRLSPELLLSERLLYFLRTDVTEQCRYQSRFAVRLAQLERWDEARAVVEAMPQHWKRGVAFGGLAEQAAMSGRPELAGALIGRAVDDGRLQGDWMAERILESVARADFALGRAESARDLVARLGDQERVRSLQTSFEASEAAAGRDGDASLGSSAKVELGRARHAAKSGRPEEAAGALRRAVDLGALASGDNESVAVLDAARLLAELGYKDEARAAVERDERKARGIARIADFRAGVMSRTALAWGDIGEKERAVAMLQDAWEGCGPPLEALFRIQGRAACVVAAARVGEADQARVWLEALLSDIEAHPHYRARAMASLDLLMGYDEAGLRLPKAVLGRIEAMMAKFPEPDPPPLRPGVEGTNAPVAGGPAA